jgi:hypothetical protein
MIAASMANEPMTRGRLATEPEDSGQQAVKLYTRHLDRLDRRNECPDVCGMPAEEGIAKAQYAKCNSPIDGAKADMAQSQHITAGEESSSRAVWFLHEYHRWTFVAVGSLLLTVLYAVDYVNYPALPGNNNAAQSLGWWGWFDQSKFLESTRALARLDLSPAHHFYPLGYALLGAPFTRVMPQHPFFLVDLAALLITYAAFVRFAFRCGLEPLYGATIFILASAVDPVLFHQWVIPWNTSPQAAAMWLLFANAAAHMQGERRPIRLGLLAAWVPMLRPTDALIACVPIAGSLAVDVLRHQLKPSDVVAFMGAVLVPLMVYGALHLVIYGPGPSDYMRVAEGIGFTFHNFGLKAYLILVDPRAWIGGGEGLIRRCPWLILGLAGIITALRRQVPAVLALALVVHGALYLTYIDLLPTSFWRYKNVHYWTFAFPGYALLAALWLRDLFQSDARPRAVGAIFGVLLLLCIRLEPVPAGSDQPSDALDVPVGPRDFNTIYFGTYYATDAVGTLRNIQQMRGFPFGSGVRVLGMTRDFHSPITMHGEGLDASPPVALRTTVHWGIPFWPWSRADDFYGPGI